jgi:hypothetical protein
MPSGIGTAGAGAELTSEQVARILVAPLQARSVVLAAGPRVFDSQGDPLSIPKLAPMSAVGMTAENVAVPESDPVFSEGPSPTPTSCICGWWPGTTSSR